MTVLQVDNPPAASLQGTRFLRSYDSASQFGMAYSLFTGLPGIRGFWPMNLFSGSYEAQDRSGNGHTLTNVTNGLFGKNNLRFWYDAAGTDYLTRTNPPLLQIIGNEAGIQPGDKGLTLGGWFYLNALTTGGLEGYMNKWGGAGQFSYGLVGNATPRVLFRISTDGTTAITVTSPTNMLINKWHFIVGRFIPSTEIAIFVNGEKVVNTNAIPATIFNSTADFNICARNNANILDGRAAWCFICNMSLEDHWIQNVLWHHTRAIHFR